MDINLINFNYYTDISDAYRCPGFLYADVPAGFTILTDLLNFIENKNHNIKEDYPSPGLIFRGIWKLGNSQSAINKIIHHDLPTLETPRLTNAYLNLLNMAVRELELRQELEESACSVGFTIYFPFEFKKTIEQSFEKYGLFDFNYPILLSEQDKL